MKILFNGLGPKDTVTHNGDAYCNGSVVDMPDEFATAYIETHLAVEVKTEEDEREVAALQRLEINNSKRRKRIEDKVASRKDGE